MSRHRKGSSNYEDHEGNFMQVLEQSLLQIPDHYGIQAFQSVFNKKKIVNQMLEKQKILKQQAKSSFTKAKQRLAQIQQLQTKVKKQTSLLKAQIDKINDAHNMSKLLMMEKILKLQREAEDIQKRRSQCYTMRVDHERANMANFGRSIQRIERARIYKMSQTIALQQEKTNRSYQTLQNNKRKADSVRLDKQRRQGRLKKIEQFKLERAHKNYIQKSQSLRNSIEVKQHQLDQLAIVKQDKQKKLEATINVVTKQFSSFFNTSPLE